MSRPVKLALLCLGALAATLIAAASAGAATITPNTTTDETTPGDGLCSLREAVSAINAGADGTGGCTHTGSDYGTSDGIVLGAGRYTLSLPGVDDSNAGGDLDMTKAIGFTGVGDGPGATVIDANGIDRGIDAQVNGGATVALSVSSLRIENGFTATDGGGIRNADPEANTTIQNSTVADNEAIGVGGGIAATGADAGILSITRSEIDGNVAGGDGGGVFRAGNLAPSTQPIQESLFDHNSSTSGEGGAIYQVSTSLTVTNVFSYRNTTFTGNTAAGGGGAISVGVIGAVADLRFDTFVGNSTPTAGAGGAISGDGAVGGHDVLLQGSLFAGNTAGGVDQACGDPLIVNYADHHYNIESGNSCNLQTGSPAFSLINTNPVVAPLADNGGQTRTVGLYDQSPAIDRVPTSGFECVPSAGVDQRNTPRPFGTACDVGAFEGSVGPVPTPPGGGGPPGTAPPTTVPTTHAKKKCKKKKHKSAAVVAKKCKKKT